MQKIIISLVAIIIIVLIFILQNSKENQVKKINNGHTLEEKTKTQEITTPVTVPSKTNVIIPKNENLKPFSPTIKSAASDDNTTAPESLEEIEIQAFKTIQPKINEEMLKLPECLEVAQNKEDVFSCNKKLMELHKELALAMGDFSEDKITGYDDTFIWNEDTKIDMIKAIESGTQEMQEMQTCIDAVTTKEELNKCLNPK